MRRLVFYYIGIEVPMTFLLFVYFITSLLFTYNINIPRLLYLKWSLHSNRQQCLW